MNRGNLRVAAAILALAAAPVVQAQYAPPPTAYTISQQNQALYGPAPMFIFRDGSKAAIDMVEQHTRTLYDLDKHINHSWDLLNPAANCSAGTFSGDWGDPFNPSDVDEMLKTATKPPVSETVNGFAAKRYEAVEPQTKAQIRIWREARYGLLVKFDMAQPGQQMTTYLQVNKFIVAKPDPAVFELPKNCGAPPPTAEQRFATEVGDPSGSFADGSMPPGSPNSCAMLLRFVHAGTMQPLSNFQVALDLQYDQNNPPHYTIGAGPHASFSGGHLKEYTAQMQNGVLRLDNVPASFMVDIVFAAGKSAEGLIYRKCSGPQTVLLYVETDKASDWIWVKSGKYATAPGR